MNPSVPTADVFESHARCVRCGYDLFGQQRLGGACPECGANTTASADSESFLALPGNADRLRSGTRLLLISALLCGLCPAVCLFVAYQDVVGLVAVMMTAIFAATAVTATLGHARLREMLVAAKAAGQSVGVGTQPSRVADVVAGLGLLGINVGAYWIAFQHSDETAALTCAGVGFFLLSVTAWRAALAGRFQSQVARATLRRAGGLAGLGYIKAVYETLWLGSCWLTLLLERFDFDAAILFAYAGLFGLFGFGGIWLAMIVVHANLYLRARRPSAGIRGFDVLVMPPAASVAASDV